MTSFMEEGDPCPDFDCAGHFEGQPNGPCRCNEPNARPPCGACEDSILTCTACGSTWRDE